MTLVLIILCVVVAVLTVLVVGLLRAYATVLQRLHQLDGGAVPATACRRGRHQPAPVPHPGHRAGPARHERRRPGMAGGT